jgi:pimeloyl-ACP methyl ester carboxylesterase
LTFIETTELAPSGLLPVPSQHNSLLGFRRPPEFGNDQNLPRQAPPAPACILDHAMNSGQFAVPSKDGVAISVEKSGSGPALLLVHGSMVDGSITWAAVRPALERHFTTYVLDRRGRGTSGDGAGYSLSDEVADLAAVVSAIGQPVTLVAHSYGAVVTLAALEQLAGVSRLILYEPPVFEKPRSPETARIVEDMERALQAGDREQVPLIFQRDQIGAPPEIVAAFRSSPRWAKAVEVAHTLPREARVVNTLRLSVESFAKCTIPTTMLLGGASSTEMREGTLWVCNSIPGCRTVILEGQGHSAMMNAPDQFVSAVLEIAGVRAGAANQ